MEQTTDNTNKIRLQKFLADNGIASRRKCEELILEGKVMVNGKKVIELGTKVDADIDVVLFEGKEIKKKKKHTYILLNKPIGYVTTAKDQFDRETVLDLISSSTRIVPVGRLDMYTSGALLLSDDGEFVYRVTHPKHEIDKTYHVTIAGELSKNEKEQLEEGVQIEDYVAKPANVTILKVDQEKKISRIEITIHEGKNRQVRKMFQAVEKKVMALHRFSIGNITVRGLKIGQWRYLTQEEIKSLK